MYIVHGPRPGQRIYVPGDREIISDALGRAELSEKQFRYLTAIPPDGLGYRATPISDQLEISPAERVAIIEGAIKAAKNRKEA